MRLILFFLFCYLPFLVCAQLPSENDTLIPLNRHYFEIAPEDTASHFYDKLVSFSENGTKLERIFTRDGKIQRVVITKPWTEEFYEQVTDEYNAYNELAWRKTQNRNNGKYMTMYYYNNEVVGQVLSESDTLSYVARNGESEPKPQRFNDFDPQLSVPINEFYEFASKKFRLSAKLYPRQPEWYGIAVLVNEHGMVDQIEWANPMGGNPKVADQYIRVVELWGNNFHPALDSFGQPVSKWLTIPFHMGTGALIFLDLDFH
ncbi:hypothetical protein GCM10009119_17300 [Algoriphagus jejuensis]|uniref:TonB-like protein n=1 Tax=Algoriphagus jejuensis TaxID=419934 RepID=A0ABN1MZ30_9BACT